MNKKRKFKGFKHKLLHILSITGNIYWSVMNGSRNMAILEIKNLHKEYGKNTVLKSINATVEEGDVIAILGPSGTGKSSISEV